MIRKISISFILLMCWVAAASSQAFVKTSDLFAGDDNEGTLQIVQDPALDTLISRYIMMSNRVLQENEGNYGMDGYRIQIYNSSNRNAKDESNKARAEFMNKFPGVASYRKYSEPGYFKVRVGDFRTKAEATKFFLAVSRVFPNAYLVPDIINFPERTHN